MLQKRLPVVRDRILRGIVALLGGFAVVLSVVSATPAPSAKALPVQYANSEFGFRIGLPESWRGYKVDVSQWDGTYENGKKVSGPVVTLNHPLSTAKNNYQAIPVMVFTISQFDEVQNEIFRVSAAPYPPTELGRNSKFVLALPPRYNFTDGIGREEVAELVKGLVAIEPVKK